MNKIKQEELNDLQSLNTEFNKLKTQLGDVAIHKNNLLKRVEQIRNEFGDLEKKLMNTYGEDSIINLETGEIKQKENGQD